MLTVLTIIGTRPEAVKMAPVIAALRRHDHQFKSVVCSTGQHRELLQQILSMFQIAPDLELGLMTPNQPLADLTASLMINLDRVMADVRPDWVLAQGDTTSVMAASLVAFYRNIRFGHVEAGLRTGDRRRPFPEEINRRIADLVATLYFAPTALARQALLAEGVADSSIRVTGNTVVDALIECARLPFDWATSPLAPLRQDQPLVLITAHRRESFGEPFKELCLAIREIAQRATDHLFVYPVHLNPNVRRPVQAILSDTPNIKLIEPVDYLCLIQLLKMSRMVLTDSGGIQEEAPSFGVPVLVMRDNTERPEGVAAGAACLVGTSRTRIVTETLRVLTKPPTAKPPAFFTNPFGDGRAAERIVDALLEYR